MAGTTIRNVEELADAIASAIAAMPIAVPQPPVFTRDVSITRPADTNAYAANDTFANATSTGLVVGGYVLPNMARSLGGGGKITDAVFTMSASTALQGEIWLFDAPVTAIGDNAAFDVTDAQVAASWVGVIPFNTTDVTASNAGSYANGLDIRYNCRQNQNSLWFMVKVMNAPTPASGEVLSIRIKGEY